MKLCLYLTPELIIAPLASTTKEGIIAELVRRLAAQRGINDASNLLTAVMERERTGSTFLPSGIAIPHARVASVNDIVIAMGVSREPVEDTDGPNALSARIFCLFFSPTLDKEFGRHLKLLARISAVFSDPEFIDEIASLSDAGQIFEALQKRERTIDQE